MRKYQNKLMICSKAIGMKICHFILEPSELKSLATDTPARPTMVPSTSPQGAGRPLAPCHCTIVSYLPTLLVEIASPNQLKLGEHRPQDLQVEVVSEVSEQVSTRPLPVRLHSRPDDNEESKDRLRCRLVDVVDAFRKLTTTVRMTRHTCNITHGQEDITKVHGDEDGHSDVGHVHVVTPSNQPKSDSVLRARQWCTSREDCHSRGQ